MIFISRFNSLYTSEIIKGEHVLPNLPGGQPHYLGYMRDYSTNRGGKKRTFYMGLISQQHSTYLLQNMQISFTFTAIKS